MVGLHESQSFEKNQHWFNVKVIMSLLLIDQFLLSIVAYLVMEASNFSEYANSIYLTTTLIAVIVVTALFIWKADQIFKLITNFETAIQKCKSLIIKRSSHP